VHYQCVRPANAARFLESALHTPRQSSFFSLACVRLDNNLPDVLRNGRYCPRCLRFVGYGQEAKSGCVTLEWMAEPCDWCQEREREKRAETEQLERLWAIRECAAEDCRVVFKPAATQQRFCSDLCRRRTHRRLKAARPRD
jgi:hypothetical protein